MHGWMLYWTIWHSTWLAALLPLHNDWSFRNYDIFSWHSALRSQENGEISSSRGLCYGYTLGQSTKKENRICLIITPLAWTLFHFALFFHSVTYHTAGQSRHYHEIAAVTLGVLVHVIDSRGNALHDISGAIIKSTRELLSLMSDKWHWGKERVCYV